ncbi:MAG: DUF4942 domain-containing protein [Desulfuromonas sp.]|nr:DUF4942 domain-containing protein [Desulfuromonas sp.]
MNNKQIAYPHTVRDIVQEYAVKSASLQQAMLAFTQAEHDINAATKVTGGFIAGSFVSGNWLSEARGQHLLLASAWQAIYTSLNLENVFSASDKAKFAQSLENPAPLTLENLTATFGQYWENPRYFILKGLAEVFCKLDKFYKSHSNFGVGVKGLPKRVILSRFTGIHSHGVNAVMDMVNAMVQVTGEALIKDDERRILWDASMNGSDFELPRIGLKGKVFANGNAHVHFSPRALKVVNDGLHEYYGTVLPDDSSERPTAKKASTEVSKDLQFYPTPRAAIDHILARVHLPANARILEPSCGDGALLDAMNNGDRDLFGIEYDAGRAQQARGKGHKVLTANFLEVEPQPVYDRVVMNPPFSGTHYVKHVKHAMKFLKPDGVLITILPASAWYEHKLLTGRWEDLPMGSFRESGTNINTGFLMIRNK